MHGVFSVISNVNSDELSASGVCMVIHGYI